jgi:YVTN family beta-propeller protein
MRRLRILVWGLVFLGITSASSHAKATPYAYVVNSGANSVSVINTNTNLVVKTVAVGTSPFAVAINAAGTLAYVTNTGSNTISVITTSTNTVTATIPVSSGPMDIALNPTGSTAYVSCSSANVVAAVNTGAKKVTANIAVQHPAGLAVMGNGTYLYVASSTTGKVLAISTLTNTIAATISVGTTPAGLALSPDGSTAFVTNTGSNTVTVIQTSNNVVSDTINVSAGPDRDAVSPDGHWLCLSNYNGGSGNILTVIDTSTKTVAGTVVVGSGPRGLAFGEDGSGGGVANEGSGTVTLFDTASRTVTGTITVGSAPTGGAALGIVHVSTVVGGHVGDKGNASSATIQSPSAVLLDSAGNLYISDVTGNRIRKVSTTGTITTYAGNGLCGFNGDGLVASKAMQCAPTGMTFDHAGNLVIAEQGTNRIRSISKTTGKITTLAGNGAYGNTGDNGLATNAETGDPFWPAYDSAGNLYFSMVTICVIRKVNTSGIISTVAGNGTCGYGGDGGAARAAMLNGPRGLVFDASGNMYIADMGNHRVRKVDTSGKISTFAGTGKAGFSGDGGLATSAKIGSPRALTIQGNALYISNAGAARYRFVDLTSNIINTYAGSTFGYDGDNHALLATQFGGAGAITFDSSGNPIFADTDNSRVRKATAGIVNTIAGGYIGDGGKATSAALVLPEAAYVDKAGNIFIADFDGNRVRKVSGGNISTIAGAGITGYTGDGGLGTLAALNAPQGVVEDSSGNIFISDAGNGVIRKVIPSGTISTFTANVNFFDLYKIAIDSANNLYVDDDAACVIWKITPTAVVSIAAGVLNTCGYNGDNLAATTAQLNTPYGVALDSSGNLFIADFGNNRVREVNTSGTIDSVAGTGTCGYTGDGGSPASAELCPNGVAVDGGGNVYVADNFTRIRRIKKGTMTTLAGYGFGFNGDGLWPLLTGMDRIVDVVVDSKGAVYELDDWDHRLRKIQ